ncbi:hypothetical protein C7E17_27225, partial [Stenotrophomonas maltophilia]
MAIPVRGIRWPARPHSATLDGLRRGAPFRARHRAVPWLYLFGASAGLRGRTRPRWTVYAEERL